MWWQQSDGPPPLIDIFIRVTIHLRFVKQILGQPIVSGPNFAGMCIGYNTQQTAVENRNTKRLPNYPTKLPTTLVSRRDFLIVLTPATSHTPHRSSYCSPSPVPTQLQHVAASLLNDKHSGDGVEKDNAEFEHCRLSAPLSQSPPHFCMMTSKQDTLSQECRMTTTAMCGVQTCLLKMHMHNLMDSSS